MSCCTGTCGFAVVPPGVGAHCDIATSLFCEAGAYCGNDSICHERLDAGATCDAFDACGFGYYCAGYSTTTTGTCTLLPHLGEPCDRGAGCAELGAICDGVCKKAGLPGDACTSFHDCSEYYDCKDYQCVAFPTLGERCTIQCSDGSICNRETYYCEKALPNGATCDWDLDCASKYCSDSGSCADAPVCI